MCVCCVVFVFFFVFLGRAVRTSRLVSVFGGTTQAYEYVDIAVALLIV